MLSLPTPAPATRNSPSRSGTPSQDNEEEYEDYYDYSALEEQQQQQMILHPTEAHITDAGELVIPSATGGSKVLGNREFARYYKQRLRLEDTRQSVVINQIVARYRNLGIETVQTTKPKWQQRVEKRVQNHLNKLQTKKDLRSAKIYDLPQYVPW